MSQPNEESFENVTGVHFVKFARWAMSDVKWPSVISFLIALASFIISVHSCQVSDATRIEAERAAKVLVWQSQPSADGSTLTFIQAGTAFAIQSIEMRFPDSIRSGLLVLGPGETSFSSAIVESGLQQAYRPCTAAGYTTVVDGTIPVQVRTRYVVAGRLYLTTDIYALHFRTVISREGMQNFGLVGLAIGLPNAPANSSSDFVASWTGPYNPAKKKCESRKAY